MDFFRHFFRANEDGFVFNMYGNIHLILIIIFISGIYLLTNKNSFTKNNSTNNIILKGLATILLIDQIILYAWQLGSGYFRLDMSLPLYHCRIAIWFIIIGVLSNNKNIKTLGVIWGSLGSTLAMILPEIYAFNFPHYTNFQFFIAHITLGWIISNVLIVQKFQISEKELRFALKFTNIYNISLVIFNFALRTIYPDTNYGYMLALPGKIVIGNPIIHSLIMIFVFNIGILLIYKLLSFKYEERSLFQISKDLISL